MPLQATRFELSVPHRDLDRDLGAEHQASISVMNAHLECGRDAVNAPRWRLPLSREENEESARWCGTAYVVVGATTQVIARAVLAKALRELADKLDRG